MERRFCTQQKFLAIVLVLVVAAIMCWYLYAGPNPFYDDSTYVFLANYAIANTNIFILINRFGYGFLKVYFIALSFSLFGYGGFQAVLSSVVSYMAMVILIFLTGARLKKGVYFGTLAAFIGAAAPFIAGYATRTLPDIPLGMLVALSTYLFTLGQKRIFRHKMIPVFLFGFVTALTAYINEQGFIFIVFSAAVLVAMYFLERIGHSHKKMTMSSTYLIFFFLGIAAGIMLYLIAYYLIVNDAFYVFEHYSNIPNSMSVVDRVMILFAPYAQNASSFNEEIYPAGVILILSIVGIPLSILKREKTVIYIAIVYSLTLAYMLIAPSSPSVTLAGGGYVPIPFVTRMLDMFALPIALLCAYTVFTVFELVRTYGGKKVALIVAGLLIASVFLAEVPEYAFVKSYNTGIAKDNVQFSDMFAYIANVSHGRHTEIYEVTPANVFDLEMIYAFSYFSKFSHEYSMNSLATGVPTMYYSPSCNNPTKPSFMIILYNIDENATSTAENNIVLNWLAANCTETYLRSFPLDSSDSVFRLYFINRTAA